MIISYLKSIIKEGKFDSELVYSDNDNYIKRKIMIYEDKVNSYFQDKKLSKENVSYKWLLLIMLGSVVIVNKKYYPQTLLEQCKYDVKINKMKNSINN